MFISRYIQTLLESINIFGYQFVKTADFEDAKDNLVKRAELTAQKNELMQRCQELESEVTSLRKSQEKIPFDVEVGDPTPTKAKERKAYVGEVAGFHKNFLHDKLMAMIHATHLLFEGEENPRDVDMMLKGAVYACRELDRWGNLMISEAMADSQEGKEKQLETKEEK